MTTRRTARGLAVVAAAGLLVTACSGTEVEVIRSFPGRTDWAGTMYAFDPATGEESWATRVPVPYRPGDRLSIHSVDGTLVFPTSDPVGVVAVDAGTGEPVWQVTDDRSRMIRWTVEDGLDGVGSAEMVVGDSWRNPSPRESRIMRIDLGDGTVISNEPHPDSGYGMDGSLDDVLMGWPTVALIDTIGSLDVWVVCTKDADRRDSPCADGWIEAVDTTDVREGDPSYFTGETVWRLPIDRPYVALANTPETIYLARSIGTLACCLRSWGDETWGELRSGDYSGAEYLMAVDVVTGEVRWTAEFPNTRLHATVVDDTLYVISVVLHTQYD